MQRHVQ